MVPIALLGILLPNSNPNLGLPVATHGYVLNVERALPNGTPDLAANSNHWSQATDRFYVLLDTRGMKRDQAGNVNVTERTLEFKEPGGAFRQIGALAANATGAFHYIVAPTMPSTTRFTFPHSVVSAGNNALSYIVKTTVEETEVRFVAGHRVTRTKTTESFGTRQVGLRANETYDPVTERRYQG